MTNFVMSKWQQMHGSALGRWLFTKIVCMRAPYFASISPRFEALDHNSATVYVKKRRRVTNHINTVHAIAMCNACELVAGVGMEANMPKHMRWIPKGMTVSYLAKSTGGVRVQGRFTIPEGNEAVDVPVQCDVVDDAGKLVMTAVVTMYLSPRKKAE